MRGANREINYAGLGEPFNFRAPTVLVAGFAQLFGWEGFNEPGWS